MYLDWYVDTLTVECQLDQSQSHNSFTQHHITVPPAHGLL